MDGRAVYVSGAVVMRRSKAAVSVEVKQVIGTLCRLLAATGLDAVPAPEAFRRAKFGGGVEVVRSCFVVTFVRAQLTQHITSYSYLHFNI